MSTCRSASVSVKSVPDEEFNRIREVLGVSPTDSFLAVQIGRSGEITLYKAESEYNDDTFKVPVKRIESITPASFISFKGSDGQTTTVGGHSMTQVWPPLF